MSNLEWITIKHKKMKAKIQKIIKFLIIIIKYENFSQNFGKHIYFEIDQNQ